MRRPYCTLNSRRCGLRTTELLIVLSASCVFPLQLHAYLPRTLLMDFLMDERQLSRSEVSFCYDWWLIPARAKLVFVILSWSTTIALSFLELAKRRPLWACVRLPSLRRGQPSASVPEAKWTLCCAGWLSWGLLRWTRSLAIQWCTIVHSLTVWVRSSAYMYKRDLTVWGGSKGVINFPWSFLCNAEFSPSWALSEYILALIHLACLRVFSVMPWVYCSLNVSCEMTSTKWLVLKYHVGST